MTFKLMACQLSVRRRLTVAADWWWIRVATERRAFTSPAIGRPIHEDWLRRAVGGPIMMRRSLLPFAALAALTFAPAAQAASDQASEPAMERMQHWAADHEALLDAKLAGLKAGLRLTSDQDKLWPPFETAVRDAAKLHMDQMKSMMDRMQKMREMMRSMNNSEDMTGAEAAGQTV